jgi:hypothetical protein
MITRFPLLIVWAVTCLLLHPAVGIPQDIGFQGGAAVYSPKQLHDLLVGQTQAAVINFFGRAPNHQQGADWIYDRLLIEVAEQNQYYTTAVVCFSHGDHLVWQVVCYP